MIIQKTERAEFEQVEFLNNTERAAGGFGHTGKQ
jgi:dUTPase